MIIAFTDGSGINKKNHKFYGYGGWGAYILINGREYYLQDGYRKTTTNRMEIRAILEVLKFIKDKNNKVLIYSDSQYVVKTIMLGWYYKWESCGWYCKNSDLWKQVKKEVDTFMNNGGSVVLKHIRGHQMNLSNELVMGNNIADILASYKQFKKYKVDTI